MRAWGRELLGRLQLRGDERVLDAGCGSGALTRELVARLPRGELVACDASPAMVDRAREVLPGACVFCADLLDLELERPVEVVFSSAVFHWIRDHERLFARLFAALAPAGRLVAQCGGAGNLDALERVVDRVRVREPFVAHLGEEPPWHYPNPEATRRRLERSRFVEVKVWLEPRRVQPQDPERYLAAICLSGHVARLPAELAGRFVREVVAAHGEPFVLEHVRMNIEARRAC